MSITEQSIRKCIEQTESRQGLWINFLQVINAKYVAEIGVYRGDFAAQILRECGSIEKYYMIDPWRHLKDWNKPANLDDDIFEQFLLETKSKTDFASDKRIILQGKTTEVVEKIPDGQLDFAYIDGDHTLKGIAIDLIRLFPKIRVGGWIGGDDFSKTVWQHSTTFEPTLVFPFAVYFAEAIDSRIYALPNSQFLIEKSDTHSFEFIDLMSNYGDLSLRDQFHPYKVLKLKLLRRFAFAAKLSRRIKQLVPK